MNERLKRSFSGTLRYFFVGALGVPAGGAIALLDGRVLTSGTLAGGFAHAVPGSFTVSSLASSFLWQFFPLLLLWYAAFGRLFRQTAMPTLLFRGILSGYWLFKASVLFFEQDPLVLLLLLMLWLFEMLSLCLCAGCAHRGAAFSRITLEKGVDKERVWRFTEDVAFYYGLILFFYIARGCVVALLNA